MESPYLFNVDRQDLPSLTTTPLALPENCGADESPSVLVNFEAGVVGFVAVGLLNQTGSPIIGFSVEDADPLRGNALDARASWNAGAQWALPAAYWPRHTLT